MRGERKQAILLLALLLVSIVAVASFDSLGGVISPSAGDERPSMTPLLKAPLASVSFFERTLIGIRELFPPVQPELRLLYVGMSQPFVSSSLNPLSSTLYVAPTGSGGGSCSTPNYNTISAAITAASSGDTIIVCAGTYKEQLAITTSLTLTGAGAGSTFIEMPASPGTDVFGQRTIVDINAATVTMSGFTVRRGAFTPAAVDDFLGIFVFGGATLSLSSSSVTDIRQAPISGTIIGGTAILIGAGGDASYAADSLGVTGAAQVGHATITGVTVTGYQVNGIVIDGASSTATITGNTITGAGTIGGTTPAQTGIQISDSAVGTITGNTVTNNKCNSGAACGPTSITGTFLNDLFTLGQGIGISLIFNPSTSCCSVSGNTVSGNDIGILASGPDSSPNSATISGNTLTNNPIVGMFLGEGNQAISGNSITNGLVGVGIFSADTDTQNAVGTLTHNVITGAQEGIRLEKKPGAGLGVPHMTASFNNIDPITNFGVNNVNAPLANAKNNWWGDATGPKDTTSGADACGLTLFNPGGLGDPVSDCVDYAPWLGAPFGTGTFYTDGTNTLSVNTQSGQFVLVYGSPSKLCSGTVAFKRGHVIIINGRCSQDTSLRFLGGVFGSPSKAVVTLFNPSFSQTFTLPVAS